MEKYQSAAANIARDIEERKGKACNLESSVNESYESGFAILSKISGISEEMKGICDSIGESINYPSTIIYDMSEKSRRMQAMQEILLSYAKDSEVELPLRRASETSMQLIKKISEIKIGNAHDKKEKLRDLIDAYASFDNFSGKDKTESIDIYSAAASIELFNFKNTKIDTTKLEKENIYATYSSVTALEKIADFISDYSKEGSTLSFSSKKDEHAIEITAAGSKIKIESASKELIGGDWRLMLAEYIAEKNNSYLEIASKGPSELEITISLQIDKAEMIDDFKAKESRYENALSSIEKCVSEDDLSEIREACAGQKCAMNAYSSAGKEEQEYLRTMGFQRMLDSYSGILSRAKKYTGRKADSLSSEIGQMRSLLKSATNLSCSLKGGLYNFKKKTAEGIQEKTQELSRTIRLIKLLEF